MVKEKRQTNTISFAKNGKQISFAKPKDIDYITEKIESEGGFYESDLLDWLANQDIPAGDFVDVGANIGNHTVYFAKIMGRNTWAFEPYSKAYDLLDKNITLNRIQKRVKAYSFGLSSRDSKASIILPEKGNNIGAAKVDLSGEAGTVTLKTGDTELAAIERIALVKIDVEGHELDVLRGVGAIIEKHHPILLVECMNMDEYKKVRQYVAPVGYVPVAVFGATPMIVFRNIHKASPSTIFDATNGILEHYFDLDAKFNRTRNAYQSLIRESSEQETRIETLTAELSANKKLYKELLNSKSYKVGHKLLAPGRLIKKLLRSSVK